jgi:hypothetical protein
VVIDKGLTGNPAMDAALSDIARETGKPLYVVKRVFDLMMEATTVHDVVLLIMDGKIIGANAPGNEGYELPSSFQAEIEAAGADVVELLDSVTHALHAVCEGLPIKRPS